MSSEQDDPERVRDAALRLLALREHTQRELTGKLGARGFPATVIATVLADLAAEALQTVTRFASHFVAQRCARGVGPVRVRAELEQRGLDRELIAQYLDRDAACWREALQALVAKRYGSGPVSDRREWQRRARFLAGRGYASDMIRGVLRGE